MIIHVQQLPPPKPQPPVADKSPIMSASNFLYTVILCEGLQGVTKQALFFYAETVIAPYCFL